MSLNIIVEYPEHIINYNDDIQAIAKDGIWD